MYIYLIIIVLLIILILVTKSFIYDSSGPITHKNPNLADGSLNYKGRSRKRDNPDDLLDRIEWIIDQKENFWKDSLIISIATVLILIFVIKPFDDIINILLVLFIIFIVSSAIFGYKNFHLYNINRYLIKNNINNIRCKLGYDKKKVKKPSKKIPDNGDIFLQIT